MTFRSAVMLGFRMLLGRKDGGSRHLRAAVVGIGLSLIPLIVVMVVSDGMIEGITARYIEISTYHLEAVAYRNTTVEEVARYTEAIRGVDGVRGVYPERQGMGLVSSGGQRTGVTIRAVQPEMYAEDPGLRAYLEIHRRNVRSLERGIQF